MRPLYLVEKTLKLDSVRHVLDAFAVETVHVDEYVVEAVVCGVPNLRSERAHAPDVVSPTVMSCSDMYMKCNLTVEFMYARCVCRHVGGSVEVGIEVVVED